jgi:diguanylate cyclase (GGDEF)-like protein
MLDLDDFKKVNDIYGHGVGDQLLVQVASVLQGSVRTTDAVCRIGGEEFAIILPAGDAPSSVALAERMREELTGLEIGAAGTLTVSTGIAVGPEHAANPRELVACAEAAMMTAKSRGDGLIVVFEETTAERPSSPGRADDDVRSIAHLNLLQSLSGKLVRLNDVHQIGVALADELRLLIDYHNCRVFLRDGDDLVPIAFRGDLTSAEPGISAELLPTKVGRGVTGRVADTGLPLLVGDAAACEFGERIAGTVEIEESLLVVPLTFGAQVTGVIVVSKLGLDQFDADDLRLLEVVAGHASSAVENARLYEVQRREAEGATALLELGRELAGAHGLLDVARRVVDESARILSSPSTTLLLEDATSGELVRLAEHDDAGTRVACGPVPGGLVLESWLDRGEPFVAEAGQHPILTAAHPGQGTIAVAPFKLEGRRGVIATTVPFATGSGRHELELLDGIAQQARLALRSAEGDESLERMFLSTVEALVTAVETSVDETSGHARTIADLSLRVGLALGLGPAALRRLELGALLHDVGKLAIPPAILRKPGPLTEAERAVVEQHPLLGERMLEQVAELEEVRRVVRSAHEHFDGGGYPDRLAGEDIPIESRIVLVCDTYDAMTTDRPYRSSLGRDEARSRLRAGAGSQFDPAVVEAFLRVLDPA